MPASPAKWLLERVDSFPKNQRFIFGQRIASDALDILALLVEASYRRDKVALLEDANRRLVKKAGTLLYLRAQITTLYERVKHREHRPLLLDDAGRVITRDQFAERIASLMDARQAGYAGADIIIDVDHKGPDAIVDEAVLALH